MKKQIYNNVKCLFDGCDKNAQARGYCKKHYTQSLRSGIIQARPQNKTLKCSVENCNELVVSAGLCNKHYQRKRKHNDVNYVNNNMHGLSKIPEYSVWQNIISRCYNSKNKSYKDYGGRGITICSRWLESFYNFYTDMGCRPSSKHEIDRINNNGSYQKNNCRWATRTKNARNKRSNVCNEMLANEIRLKYKTVKVSARILAQEYKMSKTNVLDILHERIWKDE
jgi:hypothetical protein